MRGRAPPRLPMRLTARMRRIGAMGNEARCAALQNLDIRAELEEQVRRRAELEGRVGAHEREVRELHEALKSRAGFMGKTGRRRVAGFLPSREGADPAAEAALLSRLDALAIEAGFERPRSSVPQLPPCA